MDLNCDCDIDLEDHEPGTLHDPATHDALAEAIIMRSLKQCLQKHDG